jgi:peptidoglycan-associated lipoprotein
MLRELAGFKLAAACCCFLALAACSKKSTPDLEANAGTNGLAANGVGSAVPGSEDQFKTEVGDRIFFLVDQSNLTPEAQETLRKQAAWLQQYPDVIVQIEGHADERGTREYNIALSARRGTAAKEFLISQGVAANRVTTIAFGKERPVALCDSEQCWSQNRRAVTVITGGAKTS